MLKDIFYKSNILDGLFTSKDFEFLKDTNNKQQELEYEIELADLKINKIIEKIKNIELDENKLKTIDATSLKEYVDSAEKAFDSINTVIRNLNNILEDFNEIEKEILELVVKKDADKSIDVNDIVEKINIKIENFKAKQSKVENENLKYNIIINNFLNEENIDSLKQEKIVESKQKSSNIEIDVVDHLELKVSERQKRVYLPYTRQEIQEFLENYPDEYKSARDVIEQEFIADISIYNKHPVLSRFREAYSLARNKEMKSTIDSLKFAMDMMFRSDINPAIIAAVKSQKQLETYIECLENNKLDKFTYFTITFEVSPI